MPFDVTFKIEAKKISYMVQISHKIAIQTQWKIFCFTYYVLVSVLPFSNDHLQLPGALREHPRGRKQ